MATLEQIREAMSRLEPGTELELEVRGTGSVSGELLEVDVDRDLVRLRPLDGGVPRELELSRIRDVRLVVSTDPE